MRAITLKWRDWVRKRGLAAAAARLNATQSTISARIQELETRTAQELEALRAQLDEERAIRALPQLLTGNNDRQAAFDLVRQVATASGPLNGDEARRLQRVQALFLGGGTPLTEAAE